MGRNTISKIGGWAFVIGLILAIFIAIFGASTGSWSYYVLAVLGLIVGILNVSDREAVPFLVAAIAFMLTFQSLGSVVVTLPFGSVVATFFDLITVFVAPAAAIVAFSVILSITKD